MRTLNEKEAKSFAGGLSTQGSAIGSICKNDFSLFLNDELAKDFENSLFDEGLKVAEFTACQANSDNSLTP